MRDLLRPLRAVLVVALLAGSGAAVAVVGSDSATVRHARADSTTPTLAPPAARPPVPVLGALVAGPPPLPPALRAALAGRVADAALGSAVAGTVVVADGSVLWASRAATFVPPASTAKLATAVAALTVLPNTDRLVTRVVRSGRQVILIGGGDPTLVATVGPGTAPGVGSLDTLALSTARTLRAAGIRTVRVGVDAHRYVGSTTDPGWKPGYLTEGDVGRVTALMVDGGRARADHRGRVPDPVGAAATAFIRALAAHGVRVSGPPRPVRAPAVVVPLASAQSPPVPDLVETMLTNSDNDIAEALAREVAGRYGLPRSFAGGVLGVRRGVAATGVNPAGLRLADASGLSLLDRVQPSTLTALLVTAIRRPDLRPLLSGLPVAGFTGTLSDRYRRAPAVAAAGIVRAKTGTLTGVSALAGVVLDRSGALLAFSFVASKVTARTPAEAALDRLAATLADCGCR